MSNEIWKPVFDWNDMQYKPQAAHDTEKSMTFTTRDACQRACNLRTYQERRTGKFKG